MATFASPTARVFRSSKGSRASLLLDENEAALIGDSRNFVAANNSGVIVRGPVSFISDSSDRRSSGLFIGLPDFMQMIPSTIMTPLPHRIPFPPIFAVAAISKDLAFFMALMV